MWRPDLRRSAKKNRSANSKDVNMKFYQAARHQVGMANQRGVPIMAGTDVTDTYIFPGFGLHTELQELTDSGLSNSDALRSATIVAAKFCGLEQTYGSIEEGKMADMIVLDKNPLESIENTRSINGVFLNGVYYDQATLDQLKEISSSVASSFHLNVKFAFSLLSSPVMRQQIAD